MNNVINFPKKKLKRKYVKKKTYCIAQVPKFRPLVGYGVRGIKEVKQNATSMFIEYLKCYKTPETMFHFIKIPFKKKGDWRYENVCKYVDKQMKRKGKDVS